jgi:xylulokinase
MAPEVLKAGEAAGSLTAEAARRLGLSEDVIVAVGTNDQSVGAIGAGNVTPGCASMTLGTALAVVFTTGACDRVPPGVIASPHPAGGGLWTMLTYAKTAGIVLRWFRDTFAPGASYGEVIAEAAAVPVGSGGVSCVPHFSGTATPSFNPSVRGAFAGISLGTTRAHMARAVLESLSFTVRENVELLVGASGGVGELRAGGGGARSDVWLQMIADATGVPVERPVTMEAACLGAAELAMVAAGRFDSIADASLALYRAQDRFAPDAAKRAAYDEAFARYGDLYRSLYGGRVSRCTEE